jgi:uncharacterized protein (DUF1330 family)
MKYTHPPGPVKVFTPSDEFKKFKTEKYHKTGKILAQDYSPNLDQRTETVVIVFKDKQTFDEWNAEPLVQEFFQQRDEFLQSNLIYKISTAQEV